MKRQLSIREVRVLVAEDDVEQLQCSICLRVLLDALTCREGHMVLQALHQSMARESMLSNGPQKAGPA
jgi:hypothetical protein